MLLVAEIDQRIQTVHSFGDNIAAFTTITAIRPAVFNILFTTETDATVPAGTRTDVNFGEI